jgi:hypothetical protein
MPVELCWPLARASTDARTRLAQTLPVYAGLLHPREIVGAPDVVLCTALAPLLVFLRGGVGRNERLRASLGVGLVLGGGLSIRRGLLLLVSLGPRTLTGCPPLVCIQLETTFGKRGVAIAATEIAGASMGEARSPLGAGCELLGRASRRGRVAGDREVGRLASGGWRSIPVAAGLPCLPYLQPGALPRSSHRASSPPIEILTPPWWRTRASSRSPRSGTRVLRGSFPVMGTECVSTQV